MNCAFLLSYCSKTTKLRFKRKHAVETEIMVGKRQVSVANFTRHSVATSTAKSVNLRVCVQNRVLLCGMSYFFYNDEKRDKFEI